LSTPFHDNDGDLDIGALYESNPEGAEKLVEQAAEVDLAERLWSAYQAQRSADESQRQLIYSRNTADAIAKLSDTYGEDVVGRNHEAMSALIQSGEFTIPDSAYADSHALARSLELALRAVDPTAGKRYSIEGREVVSPEQAKAEWDAIKNSGYSSYTDHVR